MKRLLLVCALSSWAAVAQDTKPVNESVDPELRKSLYDGMIGCGAYHATLLDFLSFSKLPRETHNIKSAKFLSAAHLFHTEKSITKSASDFETLRIDMGNSIKREKKEDITAMLADIDTQCRSVEEYADLALQQNYSMTKQ